MILLDATTKSVQVLLDGAVTTTELPYVAGYADLTSSGTVLGELDGTTNGATPVTVVSAPAASTTRKALFVNVYNADSVPATVTVRVNNNGTTRILVKVVLGIAATLLVNNDGWKVVDANGQLVVTVAAGSLAALTDVSITAAATGDYLRYNGTDWVDVAASQVVTDINASLDHGTLAGLTDDDHTGYARLAGRSSGQTLVGGTGASETLTLSSTAHGTKGVVTLADEVLSRPELRDHSESKDTGTISTNTLAVDYTVAAVFAVALNANITTFTIANPSPSGKHCAVTFVFTADGTIRSIVWPSGTVWPAGTAPTMTGTNNKRDIITLITFDAGTTWFGLVVGQNF